MKYNATLIKDIGFDIIQNDLSNKTYFQERNWR